MTRKILSGLLAVVGVTAIGFLPTSCQSGGIGDPCTPEDEYNPNFSGFKVTEDNIESRSFQCQSRICLVNHFQGRVSCPLGQPAPTPCTPSGGGCPSGSDCKPASSFAPFCAIKCTANSDCNAGAKCTNGKCSDDGGCPAGFTCHDVGHFCGCDQNTACPGAGTPQAFTCDTDGQCKQFVCHKPNDCQVANNGATEVAGNAGKACCVPGQSDIPIAGAVCGQCDEKSNRSADKAVYCSCRCGEPFLADGKTEAPRDPNFNYCTCPDGFECKEIRKNIGIGDPLLAGQYCIKTGTFTTAGTAATNCAVKGFFATGTDGSVKCDGTPTGI